MNVPVALGRRATFDFFAAQASARRQTVVLIVSFALALLFVVAFAYFPALLAPSMLPSARTLYVASALFAPLAAYASSPSPAPSHLELFQPGLLLAVGSGVATVTGLGAAYYARCLAEGGGDALAEMLGGTAVERSTRDPALRRFINVVEEMAIASGLPVPRLYVLESEPRINAFAAGYTTGHSVVAVTRGALDRLTRDELQGVVAHELSHILNGDTRIDLRLMAAVGGLSILSFMGRFALRGAARLSSWGRGGLFLVIGVALLLVTGLTLLLAGAFGVLCAKLVRYAVARQREWLADASAVQFTRNPDGLAAALHKIALEGSNITSLYVPEAAHLLFASGATGFLANLFSTHPPLAERIRRISPHALAGRAEILPASSGAGSAPHVTSRPALEHLTQAAGVLERVPPVLTAAAREPFAARAIACALLSGDAPDVRARQREYLARRDPPLLAEVERLLPALAGTTRAERIALLGLALPALDALSTAQRAALEADLRALSPARGSVTLFDLAVRRIAMRRLARGAGAPPPPRLRTLEDAGPECLELLSNLAWVSARDGAAAQVALDAGARVLRARSRWKLLPRDRLGLDRLDSTLTALDEASPSVKARILEACVATVLADARVTIDEAELVRAVSASLGLAMPPVVSSAAA